MESGAEGRGQDLELSSKPDVIVDKKGYMTSAVPQRFGYDESDVKFGKKQSEQCCHQR